MTDKMKKVPLNKRKSLILLFVSLAFVAGGVLLAIYAEEFSTRNPSVVRVVGLLITASFGLGVLVNGRKLFDDRPGLRFDSEGFDDFSSFTSAGRIEWREVSGLRVRTVDTEKFLSVELNDPSRLLETGPFWIRWLRAANLRIFGSPVQISSNSLKMRFDELVQTFESYVGKSADAV